MLPIDIAPGCVQVIVTAPLSDREARYAPSLDDYSRQGFRAVALYEEEDLIRYDEEEEVSGCTVLRARHRVITRTRILMVQDPETALAAAEDARASWKKRAEKAEEELEAKEQSARKHEKELAEVKKHEADARANLLAVEASLRQCETTKWQMEKDIGKIRAAIGERSLKEILGT